MIAEDNELGPLIGKAFITADDTLRARRFTFATGQISQACAELIFRINDRAGATSPEWKAFFIEALTDYVVRQRNPPGYVDDLTAAWLIAQIAVDGALKGGTELELLIRVLETADEAPQALVRCALRHVETSLGAPGRGEGPTITADEVRSLERVLYAFGGDGGSAAVSRAEAELLFRLNDRARGRANAPAWRGLFAQAIGNALLVATGHRAVNREEALRRQAWLEAPAPKLGETITKALAGLVKARPPRPAADAEDLYDVRAHEASQQQSQAERLDPEEALWLAEQIGRDGALDDNEIALLVFVAEHCAEAPEILRPLLDRAAAQVRAS